MMQRRRTDYPEDLAGLQAGQQSQFVTFSVDGQRYAIDILQVREIRMWTGATPLPSAPAHVCGVFNLRGAIIPVIDMRKLFGLNGGHPGTEESPGGVVVIVTVETGLAGLLVDAVNDIVNLPHDSVAPLPAAYQARASSFFSGMIATEGELAGLLDPARLAASLNDQQPAQSAGRENRHVA